jgi:NADPH:quinone reductase-like Zn-dependent oxidoreductase
MRAAYASAINPDDPLAGLTVGELAEPATPDGWVTVDVKASALNHHDLWSLRGVGLGADRLPMILGCDAAGTDPHGNEVVIHAVIGGGPAGEPTTADETMDPKRTLLSELYPGTLADRVRVPRRNLIPKPVELSFAEAASLPTAWLTAYRMLRVRGRLPENGSVLVQGAGGGVATAAVVLAVAFGARVYATSRDAAKRAQGGRIGVSGSTSGHIANVDLRRVFFLQQEIIGSTMGTRDELAAVMSLCTTHGLRPIIDSVYAFSDARSAFERLESGDVFGKVILDHTR